MELVPDLDKILVLLMLGAPCDKHQAVKSDFDLRKGLDSRYLDLGIVLVTIKSLKDSENSEEAMQSEKLVPFIMLNQVSLVHKKT